MSRLELPPELRVSALITQPLNPLQHIQHILIFSLSFNKFIDLVNGNAKEILTAYSTFYAAKLSGRLNEGNDF